MTSEWNYEQCVFQLIFDNLSFIASQCVVHYISNVGLEFKPISMPRLVCVCVCVFGFLANDGSEVLSRDHFLAYTSVPKSNDNIYNASSVRSYIKQTIKELWFELNTYNTHITLQKWMLKWSKVNQVTMTIKWQEISSRN